MSRGRKGGFLLLAIAAIFTLSVATGYLVVSISSTTDGLEHQRSILISMIAFLVCVLPIVRRLFTDTFDVFEPIVLAATMLALLTGVRPIVTVFAQEYVLANRLNIEPYFDRAVLLGAVGSVSFIVAYELVHALSRGRMRVRRTSINVRYPEALKYAVVISVLGMMLYGVYVNEAGGIGELLKSRSIQLVQRLGSTSEYFSAAPIAVACAGTLLVIARRGSLTLTQKLQVAAFAAVPAMAFAMLGNRRFIIPCILLPIVVGYLSSGKRPRTAVIVAMGTLAFMVLATIPYARTEGARKESGGAAAIYREAFASPALIFERFVLGEDTAMIPYLSLQVRYQDGSKHFYYGRATVGDFLIAPIPSSVFPGKPMSARDDLLTRLFGNRCTYTGGGLCPDFSAVGTFYQDFALPGVVGGLALMGGLAAGLWRRFLNDPQNPYVIVIVAVTTIFLPIILRAGTMPGLAWSLYFAIPTLVGVRFARARTAGARSGKRVSAEPKAYSTAATTSTTLPT